MKAARKLRFVQGFTPRRHFGFHLFSSGFIFVCPCRKVTCTQHLGCLKRFTDEEFYQNLDRICATMSYYNNILYLPINKHLFYKSGTGLSVELTYGPPIIPLSNLLYTLFIYYGKRYYHKHLVFRTRLEYEKNIKIFFKVSLNKKLKSNQLVIDNNSTDNIDRSNINFRKSFDEIKYKYKKLNFYYLKLLNKEFKNKIHEYYSQYGKYRKYDVHQYEFKNKIPIPVNRYTLDPTPSEVIYYPVKNEILKLQQFINNTSNYILSLPQPPENYNPFNLKHTYILDDYFRDVEINYTGIPPPISYDEAVTKLEKLFPNKKYLFYHKYKDMRCYFCAKKGHPVKLCDDTIIKEAIKDPYIRRLVDFILNYPKRIIHQRYGTYDELIWSLPKVYDDIIIYRNKFWNDFGGINPFVDKEKYWTFGDFRRRDIGFWWAIGASRVYLLKLAVGHESKKCTYIPRMQLKNHKSLTIYNKEALDTLHEYISLGILKIIPESAAKVILPMSCLVNNETGKVRVVVDGKPINNRTPAMKFTPNKQEAVKSTLFRKSRVLTQDAKHAFFQLKTTPEQALYQCVKFYYPPAGKEIVCSFITEFFGGKLSCYRYKKMEDVINNFFVLCGIKLNAFYDDAVFYAKDDSLHAAVLGSFIKRIYYGCGRILKEQKTDLLYGSYIFKFCGFLWNTKLMKYQPLEKLIISSQRLINEIVSNNGNLIPIKKLVQLIGKLVYAGLAMNVMSILLSPLKEIVRVLHRKYPNNEIWDHKFRITDYLCDHLLYLKQFITKRHVVPIVIRAWDCEIVSDVSDRMAGSHDSDGYLVTVPLSLSLCTASSCLRELYGIYVAILNRLEKLKGKTVRILVDNLGTATVLMRNGSKILEMNKLIYQIIRLCVDNNIRIWVRWLRRDNEAIVFADDLSKCLEVDRWLFNVELVKYFIDMIELPTITVDLLADNRNKICSKYYSRYRDGFSIDCNWMNRTYEAFIGEICYLNPPFRGDYLNLSVNHIIMKQIDTYMILPVWPSAIWYSKVLQYARIIIELPEGPRYFQSPPYMTTRATKKWRLIFVFFCFSRNIHKKRYFYDPMTDSLCLLDRYHFS